MDATGAEVGAVTLFLEPDALAYYYYVFFDLNHSGRNLGLFMMTTAAEWFAARGFRHLYLGSCYSQNALYKTQFAGIEFFNGFRWSDNLAELKCVLARGRGEIQEHLLESEAYRAAFCVNDQAGSPCRAASGFGSGLRSFPRASGRTTSFSSSCRTWIWWPSAATWNVRRSF